ncbi:MAG: chorismate synthase [Clostridia bacterium]|nr:chorismate synthase [Clostridia bacterium]
MKNTFGNNLKITLFGESHGEAIGCVLDGITPGVAVDMEYIKDKMLRRAARGDISTPRREADEVHIVSGVKDGYTEGTPICIIIKNENTKSGAYSPLENTPRPSHADYTAECKYHGFQDKRGGGHFSGRITAPIVAAGAIVRLALDKMGIKIGSHIRRLHQVYDDGFGNIESDVERLQSRPFPTLSETAEEYMRSEILDAKDMQNSVGGIIETAIIGVPAGVGEPWFDTLEGMLAHAMLSIPAVKGIEFGLGFDLAGYYGSEVNDEFTYDDDGRIITRTNNNGGINGGISNGMPIVFSLAVKPTPSISREQRTVDLTTGKDTEIVIGGRHDPAIIHRACAVVDALSALVIGDMLITRFGTDALK